ncbi:MAG: hypothetical protein H6859_00955 [Rhodospirillales bacterium]|nr:MAG: hypothetical protein H6859_00955 [Rhodospirillales bacterium]
MNKATSIIITLVIPIIVSLINLFFFYICVIYFIDGIYSDVLYTPNYIFYLRWIWLIVVSLIVLFLSIKGVLLVAKQENEMSMSRGYKFIFAPFCGVVVLCLSL